MRVKNKIFNIAGILIKELIRDKIFISFGIGAILLILSSLILNEMVVGVEIKATKDIGLSIMQLFAFLIVLFPGISLINNDVGRKSLYFMFSKKVTRTQYLISGYISILFSILVSLIITGLSVFIISFLQKQSWIQPILINAFFVFFEMLILTSFAILFSVVTSSQLSMFLLLLIYIMGHTIKNAILILENSKNLFLKYFLILIYTIIPDLEFFNKKTELLYSININSSYFIYAMIYSISFSVLIFLLANYLFERKEI